MKITLDDAQGTLTCETDGETESLPLYSPEAFEYLSHWWLKVGWQLKYTYSFSWLGRPVIQLPEDMLRIQEVIYALQPDVLVETGVAHGGSLVFYASLFHAMGRGRVIGVDIDVRPHNRTEIEAHELSSYITLIEGSSVSDEVLSAVKARIQPSEKVLVVLDSNHTYDHVAKELEVYAPMVSVGSYIVATDGIMGILHDVERGNPGWKDDNPARAAADFARAHPGFELEVPQPPFNEGQVTQPVTHWPGAYLRRLR